MWRRTLTDRCLNTVQLGRQIAGLMSTAVCKDIHSHCDDTAHLLSQIERVRWRNDWRVVDCIFPDHE